MKDFFMFRKMLSPILIQILFWISIIFFIGAAVVDLIQEINIIFALEILILGPLVARVVCELLILTFQILGELTQIKNILKKNEPEK